MCGCVSGNATSTSTVTPYLAFFSSSFTQEVQADAQCKASALLQQAAEYGMRGYTDYQIKNETKSNVIYQILFSLERQTCLTHAQENQLLLYLQRATEGIKCNA